MNITYVNQYGTEYAVRKQDKGPALMCRQRNSSEWVLSGTLANLVGDAKTDKELQAVLDKAAADKGWDPIRGFPDWELPMVQEILTWPWMPKTAEEFTAKHFKELDEVRHHMGGSIATGIYDTGPQGIKFSKLLEDGRVDADHTWADFVRRCIAQGIAPVPNADPISAGPASSAAESAAGSDASPAAESASSPDGPESDEAGCPLLEPVTNSTKYTCKCSICGEKFPNREICNKSFESCGWYQDWIENENKKHHSDCQCRTCEKESCFAHGCDKECPENAESTCLTTNCPEYQGKKDGIPCTNCRCPECNDDACPQAQCDGSDKGLGCMAPDDDCPPQTPTDAALASPADAGAAAQSLCAAEPASLEAPPSGSSAFDYTGLDAQTVQDLRLAEREFAAGRRLAEIGLRRMADGVAIAHDALCVTVATLCRNGNGAFSDSEKTFGRWCESVGLNRKAAERLLQVSRLFDNSSPRQQKALEELGPTLLYAAAKPSAPAELVQAVKDGDITSHKQYQDLLKKYKKSQAEMAQMEKRMDDNSHAANAACTMLADEQKRRKMAEDECAAVRGKLDETRKERDGARDALRAAKMRADKWQAEVEAIKAKPIESQVVDDEEVNRRAQELADKQTAELRQQLADLQAEPSDAEQASRDAYDAVVLSCRTIENTWKTIQPMMSKMDDGARRLAINQIAGMLEKIENEVKTCL